MRRLENCFSRTTTRIVSAHGSSRACTRNQRYVNVKYISSPILTPSRCDRRNSTHHRRQKLPLRPRLRRRKFCQPQPQQYPRKPHLRHHPPRHSPFIHQRPTPIHLQRRRRIYPLRRRQQRRSAYLRHHLLEQQIPTSQSMYTQMLRRQTRRSSERR